MDIKFIFRKILYISAVILCTLSVVTMGAEMNVEEGLVRGNSAFALNFYTVVQEGSGNLFFSPYSISSALAMTWAGARGTTAEEMAEVLQFPQYESSASVHKAFASLQKRYNVEQDGWEMSVANRLFGQEGEPFRNNFLMQLQKWYKASLKPVDFSRIELAVKTINNWVELKTHNKIKNLVNKGSLMPTPRLVLVNAIWFKGQWGQPFESKSTRESPFHISPEKSVKVSMMHQQAMYPYFKDEDISIVELPYAGGELAMIVILPNDPFGLAAVEEKLQLKQLRDWLDQMQPARVRVELPKFKLTQKQVANKSLKQLGIQEAFTSGANFTGISHIGGLYISKVIHKAFIDVNEEGTEAAAATAVIMARSSALIEPELFLADHPFIFLIHEVKTGSILFMGRLVNPVPSE